MAKRYDYAEAQQGDESTDGRNKAVKRAASAAGNDDEDDSGSLVSGMMSQPYDSDEDQYVYESDGGGGFEDDGTAGKVTYYCTDCYNSHSTDRLG